MAHNITWREERRRGFLETCDRLSKNDPTVTELTLNGNVKPKDARRIGKSVLGNTYLEKLDLSFAGLGPDMLLQLNEFLRSSPSLRSVSVSSLINENRNGIFTSILLESLSHSKSVTSLSLRDVIMGRAEFLEDFLATTESISKLQLSFCDKQGERPCPLTSEQAKAAARGIRRNESLQRLEWVSTQSWPLEEVLYALYTHPKLKELELSCPMTQSTFMCLRALLQANHNLASLSLDLHRNQERDITHILAGLGHNSGVKKFEIFIVRPAEHFEAAQAWTEMLEHNSTLEELIFPFGSILGEETVSAIVPGLRYNTSLRVLRMDYTIRPGHFDGREWQRMLHSNASLRELSLKGCHVGDDAARLAQGLSSNDTLTRLDVSSCAIPDRVAAAFATLLRKTKTLRSLNLGTNPIGEDGAAAIAHVLSGSCLRELGLGDTDLGSAGCRYVLQSLIDNRCLTKLNLSGTKMSLDECGDVLSTMLADEGCVLEVLDLECNRTGRRGMTYLTDGLCCNRSLIDLNLSGLSLDNFALLQMGNTLTVNTTLQVLDISVGEDSRGNTMENTFDADGGLALFFPLLARMKGLKRINGLFDSIYLDDADSAPSSSSSQGGGGGEGADVAKLLVDALVVNTVLERVGGVDLGLPPPVRPLVHFYLGLNKRGRRLLDHQHHRRHHHPTNASNGNSGSSNNNNKSSGSSSCSSTRTTTMAGPTKTHAQQQQQVVPVGLWADILASMSSPRDAQFLFYFLHHQTNLVQA